MEIKLLAKNALSKENIEMLGDTVGMMFVSRISEAFKDSGYDDIKWKSPRMTPNVPGIISYLNEHSAVKSSNVRLQEYLRKNKPLIDTGALRNSFIFETNMSGNQWGFPEVSVIVGSTVDYSRNVNFGIGTEIPISQQAKENIRNLTKRKGRFGFLKKFLKKATLKTNPYARVLIHIDNTLRNYLRKAFEDWAKRSKK